MKIFQFILTFKNGEKLTLTFKASNYQEACNLLFNNKYIIFDNLWAFNCEVIKN